MSSPADNPTIEFYGHLDKAFLFFNERLFDGELPKAMFELTNKKKVGGFFKPKAWQAVDGTYVHSIAINPQYIVNSTPVELYGIIVHEQVHMWQHLYGDEGRGNYHNKEWAEKMESIGLMPSDTGKPGGKKTGQTMSDYPIAGGLFDQACIDFILEGNYISFVDASIDEADVLKFRNQLIGECAKKGESLAEHYNNFFKQRESADTPEPVRQVSIEEFMLDEMERSFLQETSSNSNSVLKKPAQADEDQYESLEHVAERDETDIADEDTTHEGDSVIHEEPTEGELPANNSSSPVIKENALRQIMEEKRQNLGRIMASESVDDNPMSSQEQTPNLALSSLNEKMAVAVSTPLDKATNITAVAPEESAPSKNKTTYQCSGCGSKLWGRPNLDILCISCDEIYTVV